MSSIEHSALFQLSALTGFRLQIQIGRNPVAANVADCFASKACCHIFTLPDMTEMDRLLKTLRNILVGMKVSGVTW